MKYTALKTNMLKTLFSVTLLEFHQIKFCACSRTHRDIKKFIVLLNVSVDHKCYPSARDFEYQETVDLLVQSQRMILYKMKLWCSLHLHNDPVPYFNNDPVPTLENKEKLVLSKFQHLLLLGKITSKKM